jgi:hypothetical protein
MFGGAGSGMSGGGAGGGSPIAGMLFRCMRCFASAGGWSEGSCLSAPVLGLVCRIAGALSMEDDLEPAPDTKDGADEIATGGRMELRKGAGLDRTCTEVGRRSVWGWRECNEAGLEVGANEDKRGGGAVTERLAAIADSEGDPADIAEALRCTALAEFVC